MSAHLKMTPEDERLAARVREVMSKHTRQILQKPGVTSAGVGWRDNQLMLIVEVDSIDAVGRIRSAMPARIEGFAVQYEVASLPIAAGH